MEASTSKKVARLAEAPPAPPRISSRQSGSAENSEDDGDDAESDFDETTVKTEGGLASKLESLDERAFEDKKKVALREATAEENGIDAGGGDGKEAELDDEDVDLLEDYPEDTDELELTHARVKSLKSLRLERFAKTVKRLSLRQNLLTSLLVDNQDAPIEHLKELEEIDLYDNRISHVKGLKGLSKLTSLDLSFNLLRKVPADQLDTLPALKVIYFIQNKISKIEGLDSIAGTLESVEFGGNKLRTIENLDACTKLTELWLGKNKIARLEGMSSLKNLKILSIQSNRILKLEGLEELESLEELYISHNGIKKLEGLEKSHKLRVLDVGNNFIKEIEGISHLTQLEEFWANNNLIHDFRQVESQMSKMADLDTVYFEGNPIQKDLGTTYRRKIMLALPQLSQIDATFVNKR